MFCGGVKCPLMAETELRYLGCCAMWGCVQRGMGLEEGIFS